MTTVERIKHAGKLLANRNDLVPETRELFAARLQSVVTLYEERDSTTQALVESYRKSDTPPDDEIQLMIEAGWKLQAIEKSLNFVLNMLETR